MGLLARWKRKWNLERDYGARPEQLVHEQRWKTDAKLCRKLESPSGELYPRKIAVPFDKVAMQEEVYRFFPKWKAHAPLSMMTVDDIQWRFFGWDGRLELAELVENRRELILEKWRLSEFGVATEEKDLFAEAWRLFTLETREAPEDIFSEESKDGLAPYILLWVDELSRRDENVRPLGGRAVLALLYEYYDGSYDPDASGLTSRVEALNAGVPVEDVIGSVPGGLTG